MPDTLVASEFLELCKLDHGIKGGHGVEVKTLNAVYNGRGRRGRGGTLSERCITSCASLYKAAFNLREGILVKLRNDGTHKLLDLLSAQLHSLQDLFVRGHRTRITRQANRVGDKRQSENTNATVASNSNFGNGRHTYSITAHVEDHARLGSGLICRSRNHDVCTKTTHERAHAKRISSLPGQLTQSNVVGVGHGREASTSEGIIIEAHQRVLSS
mmetsp:Transcript_4132/g.8950  ORF Transcript_4132/g.8950 Transcript_4132/m.8950 type:complete len:215 (-) Transcript_4132:682-1326(-)